MIKKSYFCITPILLLCLAFLLLFCNHSDRAFAQQKYAQINDNAYLYNNQECVSDNSNNNALFLLPKTYFVLILKEYDICYSVEYMNIKGYVKKNTVSLVDYKPSNLYPNAKINLSNPFELELKKNTTNSNNQTLIRLKENSSVTYFGYKIGNQVLSSENSKNWLYIKYDDLETSYYGYVNYALTNIKLNFEDNLFKKLNQSKNSKNNLSANMSYNALLIIGIALSVPFIILILIMFKNNKQAIKKN